MRHLVIDITGHGFGHAALVAPVVEALRRRRPDLRLTVRSDVPTRQLEQLLTPPFERAPPPPDLGLAMSSPVHVDREASRRWYAALDTGWRDTLERETGRLAALTPDLLLANVGFLGLAAARRLGVSAVALSSLNWADTVEAYDVAGPGLLARMREAYADADLFVQITPHQPMTWLDRRVSVGPVSRRGVRQREALTRRIGARGDELLALVSFGGLPMTRCLAELPDLPGVTWITDKAFRSGMVRTHETGLSFIDLLASVDLVVTKTGYGLFVEPACHGVRVLYLPRPDWPEAPYAERWIQAAGIGRPLPEEPATLVGLLEELRWAAPPAPVVPTGIDAAGGLLLERL